MVLDFSQRLLKIPEEFREIIKLKYSSPQIRNIDDPALMAAAANCLRRIHVITGWNIPEDIEYMKILLEEFVLKLKESFSKMNIDQVTAAFRTNGLGVKDWGKNMNLDLICSVLGAYSVDVSEASIIEDRVTDNPIQVLYTNEQLENMQREWTEQFYQAIKSGVVLPVPDYAREILVKDKIVNNPGDVEEYLVRKLSNNSRGIYEKKI